MPRIYVGDRRGSRLCAHVGPADNFCFCKTVNRVEAVSFCFTRNTLRVKP